MDYEISINNLVNDPLPEEADRMTANQFVATEALIAITERLEALADSATRIASALELLRAEGVTWNPASTS